MSGADPGFLPGEGAKGLMTIFGMGMSDFWHMQTHICNFSGVYCHIMLEWCWTTIQGTPVFLLSALGTKEPAPSARVPPSRGRAPDLAPPPPWIRAGMWCTHSSAHTFKVKKNTETGRNILKPTVDRGLDADWSSRGEGMERGEKTSRRSIQTAEVDVFFA